MKLRTTVVALLTVVLLGWFLRGADPRGRVGARTAGAGRHVAARGRLRRRGLLAARAAVAMHGHANRPRAVPQRVSRHGHRLRRARRAAGARGRRDAAVPAGRARKGCRRQPCSPRSCSSGVLDLIAVLALAGAVRRHRGRYVDDARRSGCEGRSWSRRRIGAGVAVVLAGAVVGDGVPSRAHRRLGAGGGPGCCRTTVGKRAGARWPPRSADGAGGGARSADWLPAVAGLVPGDVGADERRGLGRDAGLRHRHAVPRFVPAAGPPGRSASRCRRRAAWAATTRPTGSATTTFFGAPKRTRRRRRRSSCTRSRSCR